VLDASGTGTVMGPVPDAGRMLRLGRNGDADGLGGDREHAANVGERASVRQCQRLRQWRRWYGLGLLNDHYQHRGSGVGRNEQDITARAGWRSWRWPCCWSTWIASVETPGARAMSVVMRVAVACAAAGLVLVGVGGGEPPLASAPLVSTPSH